MDQSILNPPDASVLFVCLGNICRSPMAEGVLRHRADAAGTRTLLIDSAATSDFHIGSSPDRRAQAALRRRGIDISKQRARQFSKGDFDRFDYILAMDRMNFGDLEALRPGDYQGAVKLFLDYAPERAEREVPDPYHGGDDGFEHVYRLIEAASDGLLRDIALRSSHSSSSPPAPKG